jgi:hypothetical protein
MRKYILFFYGIPTILWLNSMFITNCSAENIGYRYKDAPHLIAYEQNDILKYLGKEGYSDFRPDEIARNSTGTTLYLYNYYRKDKRSLMLSLSAGREIKKLTPPSRFAYMNDKGEFVAWFDDIDNRVIHFRNGLFRKSPMLGMTFSSFAVDPSGKYYFIKMESSLVEVASTDDPTRVLFYSKLDADKIFFKNDKVYLFARNYSNVKGPGDYEQHEIICQILRKAGAKFELEEEIHIPRPSPRPSPFYVIDFDPWSNNVLVVDVRDMPFSFLTSWYSFDLQTKKMKKIGHAKDYGFFLKEDILKQ